MATENNIQHFTAADIEKYHKGQLSSGMMHAMEKAALEDPFLADALEGYAVAGVNASADINDLKQRLAERLEEKTKVIPIGRNNNFKLLRAAAVIAFIAGASFLVYQFGLKNRNENNIAQVPVDKKEATTAKDEVNKVTTTVPATTTVPKGPDAEKGKNEKGATTDKQDDGQTRQGITTGNNAAGTKTTTDITSNNTAPAPVTDKAANVPAENKDLAREEVKSVAPGKAKENKDAEAINDMAEKKQTDEVRNNRAVVASRKTEEQNYRNQASNVFRGRVTDQHNVGIPFANVTNLEDNAGTYTDAKGNFILTYPDSVLTVQVRSLGFENSNIQLRNSVANNQVTLQDDRSLSEVVISNKKPNVAARSMNANMKLEEPEPADGWDNYDSYLANNVKLPDEYVTKQQSSGEVQVSFEVDKNGEPVNIKVEKSLCKKCDQEAIRLIKDGPKWKRKVKHGRTTVTITF
ncbi:MAG TPA: carboxypeptidase-like regulatory domain-containing protein [Chitinophagaceae bacterium]|nr:carboxypeptidase-like regulatory domain-containing protein [Chitinophagaceae bacterium]